MAWYNWSQTAVANATADPSINWAEGQAPSSVNDSARAMMSATAKYRDDVNGSLVTGGISTAYTLTTNSVYDSLAHLANQKLSFTMNATSGAAPTLSVDSLTAKPIRQATGVALSSGFLVSGSVYSVTYNNSTGEFLLFNPPVQSLAASSLLGNPTGSPAVQSAITLGGGLSFAGTALVGTLNPALVPGFISGLTLSTAGSSGTFGIAAGAANDSANGGIMALASAYTKTTASWVVGTGNGGLDTGAIANTTWYHVHLIERVDTGVVDVLFSLNASSPTMPTNYTLSRRIGSILTDSSAHWVKFVQAGDDFIWPAPFQDANVLAISNVSQLVTLSIPLGLQCRALFRSAVISINTPYVLINSPDETGVAPNATVGNATHIINAANQVCMASLDIRTNTVSQVRVVATANGTLSIATYGWTDRRGK